jgi:hypothetical protein
MTFLAVAAAILGGPLVGGVLLAHVLRARWCVIAGAAFLGVLLVGVWTDDPGFLDVRDVATIVLLIAFAFWCVGVVIGGLRRGRRIAADAEAVERS